MKMLLSIVVLTLSIAMSASAHSGRTDANGGHNCSQKSKDKGLCTGYHYHNDGGLYSNLDEKIIEDIKIIEAHAKIEANSVEHTHEHADHR